MVKTEIITIRPVVSIVVKFCGFDKRVSVRLGFHFFFFLWICLFVDVVFAEKTSDALLEQAQKHLFLKKQSRYQHATEVSEEKGQFNYDCSGFISHILRKTSVAAFQQISLVKGGRPVAAEFYSFFENLKPSSNKFWKKVNSPAELQPGDLIAWLKPAVSSSTSTGHVMIVDSYAKAYKGKETSEDEFQVSVIDSALSGHKNDSRKPKETGLGRGLISIVVKNGQAVGFRWKANESQKAQYAPISFGRLIAK